MDNDLYTIMKEIKEKGLYDGDVMYLGNISFTNNTKYGDITITKDIFALTDSTPDGKTVTKYYDENQNFLGGKNGDGELFPGIEYAKEDIGFLSEINEINSISLNETEEKLDEVSKVLGISKSDILSMSESELDKVIENKDTISISDDDKALGLSPEEDGNKNKDVLENIKGKQEINLDRKIDDRYTLADVLGVEKGSKLIAIASSKIENNPNSTRFSCLIKSPSGKISMPENLRQVGGKYSDKNVYETNRNGSEVEKQNVMSSFAIDSEIVKNGIITVNYGEMGRLEVGYGMTDKTSHRDAVTQRLETDQTWPVLREVRDEFSQKKGEYNISKKMDEIESHEKLGCKDLNLEDVDGDFTTGHNHSELAAERILEDEELGDKINDMFTFDEVKERFESIKEKFPEKDFDELVETTKIDLATDAEYMHDRQMNH